MIGETVSHYRILEPLGAGGMGTVYLAEDSWSSGGSEISREIAASLELTPERFAEMWNQLPWDDLKIADHLGLTRQQVINLRHSARARLIRRLGVRAG